MIERRARGTTTVSGFSRFRIYEKPHGTHRRLDGAVEKRDGNGGKKGQHNDSKGTKHGREFNGRLFSII